MTLPPTDEGGGGGQRRLPPTDEGGGGGQRRESSLRHRRCRIVLLAILLLMLMLLIIGLILAFTLFRPRQPRTHILSVALQGVSPRLSFPAIKVELNISLDLNILVENRNHASFRHGQGKTLLLYRDSQVGDAFLDPGSIPAMGSSTMGCHLTLEVDKFASNSTLNFLISDILAGQLLIKTQTRIPGKISFLGILHKHAVATSECQIVMGFPDLKITSQDCKHDTKI